MTPAFARRFGALRSSADTGSFKIERRDSRRSPASGTMTASYTDGRGTMGIACFEVVDSSSYGLGISTASAVHPGMIVALSPAIKRHYRCLTGVVVRVSRRGDRNRVGLRLTSRAIAA